MKKILQRIHDVIEDLNRWQFIPANFEVILEERLFLVCKLPDRLKREKTPRSKSEYNSHARQKKAREIYLEVLAKSPLNFLPFLLVVSPRSCLNWKVGEVGATLEDCKGSRLSREFEASFEFIASKKAFTQSVIYQKIKRLLFSSGRWKQSVLGNRVDLLA